MRKKGAEAEVLAEEFLRNHGYSIVMKNFYFGKSGEIDIVAKDGDTIVFVEVKARWSSHFGSALESITPHKVKSLRKAAEGFIYINQNYDVSYRFDIIALDFEGDRYSINHVKNAF